MITWERNGCMREIIELNPTRRNSCAGLGVGRMLIKTLEMFHMNCIYTRDNEEIIITEVESQWPF